MELKSFKYELHIIRCIPLKSMQKLVPFASILVFLLCFAAASILIWFSMSKNDFRNNYIWFALGL